MTFGKYRGRQMKNVPRKYLVFIYREFTGLRPDLVAYIEKRLSAMKAEIKADKKLIRR